MKLEHELPFFQAPDTHPSGNLPERQDVFKTPQPISLERMMEANQSKEADDLRREFNFNRSEKVMTLDWECPDARNWRILGTESFYFHTIANGGEVRMLRNAANSDVTKRIVVVSHEPCGGLDAKQQQVTEGIHTPESDDLSGYVSGEIYHPSELQAVIQAKKLAELTDKEVAAMKRRHGDGSMQVMAIFNRTDDGEETHIPDEVLMNPDPEQIYAFPYLKRSELPTEWRQYIDNYNEKRKELIKTDPDILDRVGVHNPQAFALKTDLRAGEIWLPGIAKPGIIFRLTSPRTRIKPSNGEKKTILNPHDLRLVWRQAQYVVSHAIENRGITEAPFRDTDRFIIATPDYAISQRIALEFAQQPFAHEWLADEQNKVLLAQNNSGLLRRVVEMNIKIVDGVVDVFEQGKILTA